MNEFERQWIELISKAYPNLHNQRVVMHSSKESDKKVEKIRKYFERLDRIHETVSKTKRHEKQLKELYYQHYVIKEENIPEAYYQSQVRLARERGYGNIELTDEIRHRYATQIIDDQKASLDKWIEYFLYDEESSSYGMWEKYWVFQGIVGLGKYDKETQKFKKRDITTIGSFPSLDREAVFNTIKLMEEYIKDKTSSEVEIKSALGSGNFKTLYEFSIKQILNKDESKVNGTDGIWVKYDQGSDYHKLRDSLQGYYTGWCTAAGENFAKTQLEGGDFYVYYSFDENNEAKIPRLAIRMDGHDKIGEIRGIADKQNIEAEMLPILNAKLEEFPDRDMYYKKENDMKRLTDIDKKVHESRELSIDELMFLYEIDSKIEGFGYEEDPRIEEIKGRRNLKSDYSKIYNVPEDEIAINKDEVFKRKDKKYKIFIGELDLSELTNAKDFVFPKLVSERLDLSGITTAEGLVLPESIGGSLLLGNIISAKNLVFPKLVGRDLDLESLEEESGLVLPESIGRNLYLNCLITAKDVVFPKSIGGNLNLCSLTTAEGLVFPESIGGDFNLSYLENAKGLVLPKSIVGSLFLASLTTAEDLVFPKSIGGSLDLGDLTTAEGLVLPESIGEHLCLCSLTTAEDLVLPKSIGKYLDLSGLTTAEGLVLPELIGEGLDLRGLTTAKGLVLPQALSGNLYLGGLTTAEDLVLPKSIGKYLDLSGLTTVEGLKLPCGFDIHKLEISQSLKIEIMKNPHLYYQDYDYNSGNPTIKK